MSGRINTMSKVKSETSEVRMNNVSSSTSFKKYDYDQNLKEMDLKKRLSSFSFYYNIFMNFLSFNLLCYYCHP